MPRVPVHTLADAPAASRPTLAVLAQRMGKVLNIHGEMAHAPVVLAAYGGIQQAIAEHGTFDARTRESIALAGAGVDRCAYCQSAHTLSGRRAGWREAEMVAIRAGAPVEPRMDALLQVAREAAGNVGEVTDVTWKAALEAGWTETELAETFAHIAVNLFTNYFNHYVDTDLDVPAAPGIPS